ncbi:uncharacterized protein [Populus alba]|uniref:uncharacterized protein n=1 Tax=Populus alba TaxID=43335 RepID=UPI003CC72D68
MARIEGREPDEEELEIPPLTVSFPKAAYVMQPDNRAEDDIQRLASMSINTLEDDKEEGSGTKKVVEMEDEVLPQLTVHVLEELPTKTFMRRLAEGCDQSKKELKIGTLITPKQTAELSALLHEYSDVFNWSYKDMPGLNTNIVVHKIPLEEGCKPDKQKLRRAHPETWIKVKAELEKQWNAGFLEVVTYPQWVSNIVVVPKKEGKIRVCVDFRDLNKASPKDDFPLPHINILVDNAARSSTYSFMDGFSGYNQIKMSIEDRAKTTFVTPWGTYCYKVMPFGLKNTGATYQRAMVTLFHDMMHKEIEVYVDDMIAKSKEGEDHVKSGKLLGFVVSGNGIEVDPDKTKAIQSMPTPKSEKEHDETRRKERAIYYLSKKFTELNVYGNGAGAVIVSPDRKLYPVSVKLHFECTNNTAEYEACILGLEDALEMKIKKMDVYGDSMLIICQVKGEWQTKEEKLKPYQEYLSSLLGNFEEIKFTHLGREGNHFADALAILAAMATIDLGHRVQPIHIDIRNNPAYYYSIEEEIDGKPWYYDIKNFMQKQEYPEEASKTDKKTLRRLAMSFYLDGEILYKRSFDGTLLRCLNATDARKALQEVHEGICSTHAGGHMMARKIQRAGYFWMTLEKDCIDYKVVKRFIEKDLICRYGVPEKIVTDNAQNFNGKMIAELCTKWKIKHSNSSPYRPKMNGAVEAANKNIKKIVQKMVVTYKDWHEMLSFALHAYRTTIRTSTGATPYSLVYGMEAVMPLEVDIPSLRVLIDSELQEADWAKKRMAKAYDKKVRPRVFQEGDLVLKKLLSLPGEDRSKWAPNYEGPYVFTANVPSAQVPVTVNLAIDEPHRMKLSEYVNYDKLTALEERLKAVEGADLYDPVHAAEMCLVPNVVVPKEFRVPEFIKYTGTESPVTHLKSYCNKMTELVNDEKLLIHFFQDSLSGSALSWYTRLDNTKIRKWKDLVKAFVEQYKFNMEVAPDRSSLLIMEKGNKETVREYALRRTSDKNGENVKWFIQYQEYPLGASKVDMKTLRRLAMEFYLDGEILYKRSFNGALLRCLDEIEAKVALQEIHEGICATHASGHVMAKQMQRSGYFWMTMEKDCIDYVRKCHKCQVYSDKINVPPTSLFNMTSSCPFAMWGIDVIGPINPKTNNRHQFILVAIDYFTKWVEASSYAHVTQKVVKCFIEKDLICRYGSPEKIVTDNVQNFNGKIITELCAKWKIKHSNSSPYRPKMNGVVEAANKNIKKIIQKMVVTYKDWHEMLPFALHAYRTTVRTFTRATPYSLIFGMEAVMPLEVEIPSLRGLIESELEEAEWAKVRYEQLNMISEKRLAAICHHQLYQ